MRGNFSNFANSTLATGIGPADTSFTVATGTGSYFPSVTTTKPDYFVVAIEQELVLCSARSGDTFTVAQRGFEGTTAASHAGGVYVVHSSTAGMQWRVWGALPDTYNPDVPPWMRGGPAPQVWDDEFEYGTGNVATAGNWTFTPQDSGQYHSFGSDFSSNFFYARQSNSNGIYWLWQPFSPSFTTFTATAKISHSAALTRGARIEAAFFISDSTNPTTSPYSGNRVQVESNYGPSSLNTQIAPYNDGNFEPFHIHVFRAGMTNGGVYSSMNNLSLGGGYTTGLDTGKIYMSLSSNGEGFWAAYVGNGYTYTAIGDNFLSLTPRSIGFRFYTNIGDAGDAQEHCMIDWMRITPNRTRWQPGDKPYIN